MSDLMPLAFRCESDTLLGILHRANTPEPKRALVVIVAGGPQYRVGAHRQFVLMARKLAGNGYPVLRFDLRGMGDSGGSYQGFERSGSDIRAAIDALEGAEPTVTEVVLFGECESASGSLFYAHKDARVKGLALVNPWVRTEEGQARTYLKHYYTRRALSKDFWRKVVRREFDPIAAARSFVQIALKARQHRSGPSDQELDDARLRALPLPERTALGFRRFAGSALVLVGAGETTLLESSTRQSPPPQHGTV